MADKPYEQFQLTPPQEDATSNGVLSSLALGSVTNTLQVDTGQIQGSGKTAASSPVYSFSAIVADEVKDIVETAGEAIDASSVPKAVYKDNSDGKVYMTDASNSAKRRYYGFVLLNQNVVAGTKCIVRVQATIQGFSGLTSGQFVYLTDTAGAISHTASTTAVIRVGIATTTTDVLLLQKGAKNVFGTSSVSCTSSDSTVTVTIGFRPRFIITSCIGNSSGSGSCSGTTVVANGGWSDSSGQGWSGLDGTAKLTTGNVCATTSGPDANRTIIIQNVTETGFDIYFKWSGTAGFTSSAQIAYIAVGE